MRVLAFLILLLVIGWWASRALERRKRRPPAPPEKAVGPERMLACDRCGVHVPESEGVRDATGFYCCDAHRRQDRERA